MQVTWLPVAVVALALVLDLLVAEPPESVHPVALFGRVVGHFDREWERPGAVGAGIAITLPLLAAGVVGGVVAGAMRVEPVVGVAIAGLLLFSTLSLRLLLDAAREVIELSESDGESARESARALVGRDTQSLSSAELRSAAVESAAENLADGLVGPLLAFSVGAGLSIAAGVAAAAFLKGVNTMDSMLGYRSKPVGRASARLDDVLMWAPARISAVLLAVVALDPGALWRARSWVHEPASPNSGWPMATLAAAGNIRLSKASSYTLNPSATLPNVAQANAAVRVVGTAGLVAFALAGVTVGVSREVIGWL